MPTAGQHRVYASSDSLGVEEAVSNSIYGAVRTLIERVDNLNPIFDEENNRLLLFVDFLTLADNEPALGEYMIRCPEEFARTVANVFCDTAASSFGDARIWLRPVNLAALSVADQSSGAKSKSMAHGGLQLISGRILSVEAQSMCCLSCIALDQYALRLWLSREVWSKTVKCSSDSCASEGQHFKILDQGTFRTSNVASGFVASSSIVACRFCGSERLVEDRKSTLLCPSRFISLCLDRPEKSQQPNGLQRTITVKLLDDLSEEPSVALGARVQVVGHLQTSRKSTLSTGIGCEDLVFVAWNVFPQSGCPSLRRLQQDCARVSPPLEQSQGFADAVKGVRDILDSILPGLQAFWRLKLMVLLTAIAAADSGGLVRDAAGRMRLHMLAHGGYHKLTSVIVKAIGTVSPVQLLWINNSDSGIVPKCSSDAGKISRMEASALSLALGGVACFGNILTVQKQAELNALREVLDFGNLVIGKDAAATTLQCPVSVLGLLPDAEPLSSWRAFALLKSFDLVHDVKEEPNEDFDRVICSFVLCETAAAARDEHAAMLKQRVHQAAMQHTEFTDAAQSLLSSFFHATRQAMAYGMAGGQHYDLQSICRIARAAAKLRLSSTIDLFDAVLAISLNEESRAAKGLPSVLSFEVLPNGRSNVELFGVDEVDAYSRVHSRIVGLCQAHGTMCHDNSLRV